MDRLNTVLEKLSDGVGLVHEYATFCQMNKAGGPRRQDMLDLGDWAGRGHDGVGEDLLGLSCPVTAVTQSSQSAFTVDIGSFI